MKNLTVLLSFLLVTGLAFNAQAQCEDESFLDDCAKQLNDFTFLKAYKLNGKQINDDKKGVEYSYVFSKATSYKLTVCDGGAEGNMVVNLYDRNRRLIASNYDKRTKKHYPSIGYTCQATGVYYLTYNFTNEPVNSCGVSILGFNK